MPSLAWRQEEGGMVFLPEVSVFENRINMIVG
jgi:hypothetical protein